MLKKSTGLFITFSFWAEVYLSWEKLFLQGFQTCISFVQLTFKWKIFLLKCVHFCSFLALWTEKIGLQQKLYRKGRTKLPFPCPEELFGKHSFPWKTYNFSVTFCFEPIKLRFSAKSLQQICQNCIIWCPRKTPMKANFTEKVTILFQLFRILSQKNLDFSKNVSLVLSKLHFSFPVNTFRKNQLVKWIQISRPL